MPNYFYLQHADGPLDARFDRGEDLRVFPEPYNGANEWKTHVNQLINLRYNRGKEGLSIELPEEIKDFIPLIGDGAGERTREDNRTTEELIATLLYSKLKKLDRQPKPTKCPTIFISHRQVDLLTAIRLANIALKEGFEVWLDVWDPDLTVLDKMGLPKNVQSILLACIVEMGLINCTHVLACLTAHTKGSFWVPYEYGRIADVTLNYQPACAYIDPGFATQLPEYLYLGRLAHNDTAAAAWMVQEIKAWPKKGCKHSFTLAWGMSKILQLSPKMDLTGMTAQEILFVTKDAIRFMRR